MIYEYALDPALLTNWKDIRYFKDNSGAEKGRLISDYPRKWDRLVFQVINNSTCGDVEKKRMKVALRDIVKYKLFRRLNSSWNTESSWIENAKEEHNTRPFRAIIAELKEDDESNCILAGNYLDESKCLWCCDSDGPVERKAINMTTAVKPLLDLSKRIMFIDPHFTVNESRFRNPLIKMLNVLAQRNNGVPIQRIEYHVSDKWTEANFISNVNTFLQSRIPAGLTLSFVRWDKADIHNRYIITDVGILRFGIGLDENTGSGSPAKDEIERLGALEYQELWKIYTSGTSFYSVTG